MWGIIDSGFGGLSLIKELQIKNKNLNLIYFGDNKYNPYGLKSETDILNRIQKIMHYLKKNYRINKFILACNTASIVIKNKYSINNSKIITISDYILDYINKNKIDNISILGTQYTINSNFYPENLFSKNINSIDAQYFVKLVEENNLFLDMKDKKISNIIKKVTTKNIVIGCTHFYFLKKTLSTILKNSIFIDPSVLLVEKIIKEKKDSNNLINNVFITTGDKKLFYDFMSLNNLSVNLNEIECIEL